jgi:hypothetical protein
MVVKHSMRNPKIEGSNPATGTGIELSCEREKKSGTNGLKKPILSDFS